MGVLHLSRRSGAASVPGGGQDARRVPSHPPGRSAAAAPVAATAAAARAARAAGTTSTAATADAAAQAAATFRRQAGFKTDQSQVPPRNFAPFNEAEKFR